MAALATGGWVLAALVASLLIPFVLSARGDLPEWVTVDGPFVTLRVEDDESLLSALARPRRLWRAVWNAGVAVAGVVAVTGLLAVFAAAVVTVVEPAIGDVTAPRSVILVPGLNGFLPLAVAPAVLVALVVALLAHEAGHALACRADDIDVAAVGALLLGALPVGAFVEHDPDELGSASPLSRARMLAAGVTANFVVAVLAVALLFGPIAGAISPAAGVPVGGVVAEGPADDAGIAPGDVLVRIDGVPVDTREELDSALADRDRVVSAQLAGGEIVYVQRSLRVAKVAPEAPDTLVPNTRIERVDGEPVHTIAGFRAAVRDEPTAALRTTNGTTTLPVGVLVSRAARSGALAAAGVPADEPFTILAVDGQRVLDSGELADVLERHEVGDEVAVRIWLGDQSSTYDVELRAGVDGQPRLGVFYRRGVSGLQLSDFGVAAYPAAEYLDAFSVHGAFDAESPVDRFAGFVLLPMAGAVGMAPYDFPGFTGHVTNFYDVTGPLAPLGGGVFVLATLLFWVAWVNLNIGLFNCLPTLPLDGGRLVHAVTDAARQRWLPDHDDLPSTITLAVTALVVLSLAVTLAFPALT